MTYKLFTFFNLQFCVLILKITKSILRLILNEYLIEKNEIYVSVWICELLKVVFKINREQIILGLFVMSNN